MQSNKKLSVEQWLQVRKEAALDIDPQTAEITWHWRNVLDPYGVYPDLPEEYRQIGREFFARSPHSEIWVSFDDLPDDVRQALYTRGPSPKDIATKFDLSQRLAGKHWIIVEGPSRDDTEFGNRWLSTGWEACDVWIRCLSEDPGFRWKESHQRRMTLNLPGALGAFKSIWEIEEIFLLELIESEWSEMFFVMVSLGFLL